MDEQLNERAEELAAADEQVGAEEGAKPEPSKKRSRKLAIIGAVVAVIVVAGIGMFVWHNDPSFCGALCHTPMTTYGDTYYAEADAPTVDKWGNEVKNSSAMLVVSHREKAGTDCLTCHVPSIGQQIGEVVATISGNYYYPLSEVSTADLLRNSGKATEGKGDEFCLNESCHNITRADLTELTSSLTRNPHAWEHSEQPCSDCHKSHRASVMQCTECHSDAVVPDGWVSAEEGKQIAESIYA